MGVDQSAAKFSRLRQQAEAALAAQAETTDEESPAALRRLVHELRVHQIELELQNEELRRTQLERELAQKDYAALYDSAPVGYISLDEDGTVAGANLTAAALLGVNRRNLLRVRFARFVAAADQDAYHFFCQRLFKTGSFQRSDLGLIKKDGTPFYARLEGQGVRVDQTDHAPRHQARIIISDITRERQAELALRESQARLEGIVSTASDAIITVDAGLHITLFNTAAARLFGYASERVLGQPLSLLLPERFRLEHPQHIKQFEQAGVAIRPMGLSSGELWGRRADGQEFPIEATISQFSVMGQKLHTVILRDLTERKQAEAAMRYQAALVDNVSDAVVATDPDLNITFWNKAAEKIYGWPAAEVLGKSIIEVIPAEFPGTTEEAVAQQLLERGYWHGELIQRRKDGTPVYALASTSRLKNEAGELIGAVTINHDLTERKQIEEDLRRHTARNEALLKISGALAEAGLDIQAAMATIARQAALTIGDSCVITRLSDDEQRFEAIAFYHTDPAVFAAMTPLLTPAPVPVTVKWLQPMLRTGQPLFIPVLSSEEARRVISPPYWSYLEQIGVHSLLIAPVQVQGRVIGTLGVSRDRPGQPYTQDDLIFLQELADRTALTIQNADLFERVGQAHERLQALSLRLLEVHESERRYLARELHDEVGQLLTGLKFKLELSARAPSRSGLAEIQTLVNEVMGRVRNLSLDLRPSMLDDLGLLPALLWHFERYTAQTGVEVIFRHSGLEDQRFPPPVETAVYRLVQEALTNVARHAGVKQVQVQVWTDPDLLHVQVKDEGRGFAAKTVLAASSSVGLRGMQERVALLGGWLMVESVPGSGACLTVELPLTKESL